MQNEVHQELDKLFPVPEGKVLVDKAAVLDLLGDIRWDSRYGRDCKYYADKIEAMLEGE